MDWQECIERAERYLLNGTLLRMVESQEQVATKDIVDSLEAQALLENMIEQSKPGFPAGTETLHYLLATPFRYPPLEHGSRFGKHCEPALFYGSRTECTLLHEAAYYRFVFWTGMAEPPPSPLLTQHTQFSATYRGEGLRLQESPFVMYRDLLRSPDDYSASQALGAAMRHAGIQLFEYESARDPGAGINVALYTPLALISKAPCAQKSWLCETTENSVAFSSTGGEIVRFNRSLFEVDNNFPRPAS